MRLTSSSYWQNIWNETGLSLSINSDSSFDRCLGHELLACIGTSYGQLLEVGCAPGRWMIFLEKNSNVRTSGIEYSDEGVSLVLKNFEMNEIEAPEILNQDFLNITGSPKYDFVISLGFIEHFSNPELVFEKHLEWLKPNGKLIVGIPNFSGLNHLIQRWMDSSILTTHNLKIMNHQWFSDRPSYHSVSVDQIKYIGSFEPALFSKSTKCSSYKKILQKLLIKLLYEARKPKLIDHINSPIFSSYLLASYTKV